MNKPISILSISDIHFGHNVVKTQSIIDKLHKFMFPKLSSVDMVVIGGDVTDKMISLNSLDANAITAWIIDFLHLCEKYNLVVRVLRGTYSHDYNQSKMFETLHKHYQFKHDLKYVDTLSCEHIEKYDLKVLYIPDNLPYSLSSECMEAIHQMLFDRGWEDVDYCCGHNLFDYTLPDNILSKPQFMFNVSQFSFVKKKALFGHVHNFSARENVFYNGSFDRLNHGEEGPKGFAIVKDDGRKAKVIFVENTDAEIFKTIDLGDKTFEDVEQGIAYLLKQVEEVIPTPLSFGNIRVLYNDPVYRQIFITILRQHYQNLRISMISKGKNSPEKIDLALVIGTTNLPNPTADNIHEMLSDFVRNKLSGHLTPSHTKQMIKSLS